MTVYLLEPRGTYNFAHTMQRLLSMPRQVIGRVEPGPVYVRALELDGRLGLVRVQPAGGSLRVDLEGDLQPEPTLRLLRRAFSLDLDLDQFHRHMAAADPVIAALAGRFLGARPIQAFDLWESLAWTIIGQQVNVSFAYMMKESLVRLCGRYHGQYPAFPGHQRVADLRYEQLQSEKYSRRKAEYVIDLARTIASGEVDLEAIASLPFEEAVAELVKLRGVGRWTAEIVLMDAGAPDALPALDIAVRNAVQRYYGLDHQPSEAEVRELGRAWSPWSTLTTFYLWLGVTTER